MDIIVGTLILVAIVYLLIYLLQSDNSEKASIPYATYGSYPIVGHVFAFVRDRKKLLMDCQQRYGNCFRIRLFNQRFTFVLSPSDWTSIIRNSSFRFPANDLSTKVFDAFSDLFDYPEFDADVHRQYTQYLKNRDGLRPMVVEFVRRIHELMQREKTLLKSNGTVFEWIPSGLLELSHRMIFQPSTLALFGEVDPLSLEKDFRLFDNKLHYFGSYLPRRLLSWLFPKEFEARSRLNESWVKDVYPAHESELIQARRALFRENSDWISERDIGGFQTALFWASLGNTIPAVFWCLFYILQDAKAVETIKQEIDTNLPFFSLDKDADDSVIEEWTPEQLSSCIYLDSAVNEILRLTGAPLMIRKCRQETRIVLQDGRSLTVKPDETLAHFVGATHLDVNLFPEPNKFIFDRFVGKNVDSIPGFTPFGGGKNMCPGRFFARNEMKICLALLLRYMEYKFVVTDKIPTQKLQRVGLGVAPPNQDIPIMYRYKHDI